MASSSNKLAVSMFMPSGYDYEFVDEVPDEYNCSICFYPMWKPVQTKCGHRFCKDCLEEANKRSNSPQCPKDRQELRKQDLFDDKATERLIQSLEIRCPGDGCQWLGALGDLKDHTCTPTSRKLKGGQKVKRKKTPNLLVEERSSTVVPCVYQRFGCNVKIPRKEMDKHIVHNIEHHFHITSERLLLLENENQQLKKRQVDVEMQYQDLKASFLKERDERENIAKELTSLKTNMTRKWLRVDDNLQTLNSQKGEVSKEMKILRKQIKQQIDEQKKKKPKTAVNTAMMNKDVVEKIERSRLRMETSIDELRHDFESKMKETKFQLQRELDEQARRIRTQLPKGSLESADRKTKIKTRILQRYLKDRTNKLIEQHNDSTALVFLILLFAAIILIFKCYKDDVLALLLEN